MARAAPLYGGRRRGAEPHARSPRADLPFEFMLNALRLVDGFAIESFEARTGASLVEHRGRPLPRSCSAGSSSRTAGAAGRARGDCCF